MANYITVDPTMTLIPQTPTDSIQYVTWACSLITYLMEYVGKDTCPAQERATLVVEFTNGPYEQIDVTSTITEPLELTLPACNELGQVRSVVEAGGNTRTPLPDSLQPQPTNLYFKMAFSVERWLAATYILNCMSHECCDGGVGLPTGGGGNQQVEESETTLYYFKSGLKQVGKIKVGSRTEALDIIKKLGYRKADTKG